MMWETTYQVLSAQKRIAYVVADELKKGGEISQPSLVIVADADGRVLFACEAH